MARSASRNSAQDFRSWSWAAPDNSVARDFMPGQVIAHEVADVLGQLRPGRNPCFKITKALINSVRPDGHAESRGDHHPGMPHERILDLGGADAIAGAGDDVVGPAVKPEISFFVTDSRDRR